MITKEYKDAKGFPPFTDDRRVWLPLNPRLAKTLQAGAAEVDQTTVTDLAGIVPGRAPSSISACVTQLRNVSVLMPNCSPTRRSAPGREPGSLPASTAIRVARSRSSSGYFLGATMIHRPPGLMVSIKPGARQVVRLAEAGVRAAAAGIEEDALRQRLAGDPDNSVLAAEIRAARDRRLLNGKQAEGVVPLD